MSSIYYIEGNNLDIFVASLSKVLKVFSAVAKDKNITKDTDYSYKRQDDSTPLTFNPYRTIEPLKSFFSHSCEKVSDYFNTDKETKDIIEKSVIFGVKSCDLIGHRVQDFVFLEGVEVDALYCLRRENTFIISGDCTDFKDVCHCLAWEIMPYPEAGFDLNLSPLNDGYLVEVGSKKGEELIRKYPQLFVPAKETQISARRTKRDNIVNQLKKHLLPQNLVSKGIVERLMREGYSLDTWREFMATCVECGGCNFICDTCHCFLLSDKGDAKENKKLRTWDSCQYANYARVAGGANPLKLRAQRLRFRFTKKFDFFVDNLGMPACCGCGRCIEVCPGKIDIREVLKDLAKRLNLK
jgi:ferredoxin